MNMNFFKKVMTFFSIIWNAILWRRTVKDKKSKSTENEAVGKDLPPEAVPLNSEEEAEKAFVDVPLDSSTFEETYRFQIDSETNLHDHDPVIVQDVPEFNLPATAQVSNFTHVDFDLSSVETKQVLVLENSSVLVEGCLKEDPIADSTISPPADGNDLSKQEELHLEKGGYADNLFCQNDPIVETNLIEPSIPHELLEELKDDFGETLKISSSNDPIFQNNENLDIDLPKLVSTPLHPSVNELEGESAITASDGQLSPLAQVLEKTDLYNYTFGKEVPKHVEELQIPLSEVILEVNKFEEDIQEERADANTAVDKVVSSDGDFVPVIDKPVEVNQEAIVVDSNWNSLHSNTEESINNNETHNIDPPAILISDVVTSLMDDSSADVLLNVREEKVGNLNFGSLSDIQGSISSVKLIEHAKCGEAVSELLSMDYSTNYMVRSDSMVNFLPNACFYEKPESASIAPTTPKLNVDEDWFEDKVAIVPESNCVDEAHTATSQPVDQSHLEEIMCTSTGILKLSDGGGEVKDIESLDELVKLEDDSTPENKTSGEKEEEAPITPNDFLLSGVFRYDRGGVVSDLGNPGAVGSDMLTRQPPQNDPVNVQARIHNLEYKGKELGNKVQQKEESNEYSSTKSENDTLENIDELSYDVNINITQGDNVFQENELVSNREELEMDPVAVLRRISSQGHDASSGTATNGNIPSLLKSEIYLQNSGRNNSSGHPDNHTRTNTNLRQQDHMSMGEFEKPMHSSNNFSQNLPNYNFIGQYLPQAINSEYNAGDNTMSTATSYGVNNIHLEDSIPMVSVGMGNYYETSKWQQPVPCDESDGPSAINNYDDEGGMRLVSKNDSLFYSHLRQENESLDSSEGYISKVNNEFYPFIDSASYLFRIPEEIRKDEYFNPCVGAAPSGRVTPGKTSEILKYDAANVDGFKLDERNNFMSKIDQSWSIAQRPVQQDVYPVPDGIEPKFVDGCYRLQMKTSGECEHVQKNASQSCRVWSSSEQLLPTEKTTAFLNGFETNEHYTHALDNVHPHPVDFVPMDYLHNTVYENSQNAVSNNTSGYEFINPYGVFPMLNIPFCLPDPSFVPRGPVPPFVFPIVPVNIDQEDGASLGLDPDNQNSLFPLTPQPYWVGFQTDDGNRAQNDMTIKNELTSVDVNRNYPQLQISVNEPMEDEDEVNEESPIPDPYFQLAENSSLHSVKSKAESYNGSLFCESLRSILSSHNAESDNVIPSFSCSSVRCYNPSLVVQSCETSLSNDSLPSIIVEGNYSKSIDEDYSAKEKFMNDVNTALNESMLDQSQNEANDFSAGIVVCENYEIDIDTNTDTVPEDIERTLEGIIEINDPPEYDEIKEELSGLDNLSDKNMEECRVDVGEEIDEETVESENNVNDLIAEILESIIDSTIYNENNSTIEESNCDDNWILPQNVEANIVVQHMCHMEEGFIDEDNTVEVDTDHSIGDDLRFLGNEMKLGDSESLVEVDEVLGGKVLEMSFHGVDDELLVEPDVFQNHVDVNAQIEEENMVLDETDYVATSGPPRKEMGFTFWEKEDEIASGNDGLPSTEQNVRKSRRNRRRNRKGARATEEVEEGVTKEIGIGDGSNQIDCSEERLDKPEDLQEAIQFKYSAIPEDLEGTLEEAEAIGADEDRCREDQDGDHDGHDGSLGNSSNNRKRRNRRKKRKN